MTMHNRVVGAVGALALACAAVCMRPAPIAAQDPVTWTASSLKPSFGRVTLRAKIDKGWHIYALSQVSGGPVRTTITVPGGQSFALKSEPTQSKPLSKFDENFQLRVEMFEDSAMFTIPVKRVASRSKTRAITVNVNYQACNARVCLPARTDRINVVVSPQ